MVASLIGEIAPSISFARLEAHRPHGGSDLDMVINYYWNIDLCKGLYPSIHALVVALRNGIHAAATAHYGTSYWFDQPGVLLDRQLELIQNARDDLVVRRKPQTPDDIVAALMLGFWVSLFNKPFEFPVPPAPANQLAWHDAHNAPTPILKATFPHAPNAMQSRKKLFKRCHAILRLRNRIMHDETIWKHADLPDRHAEILEMIGWLNPIIRATIGFCDDFPMAHAGGRAGIKLKLDTYLATR